MIRPIWAAVLLASLSGCDEGRPASPAFASSEGAAGGGGSDATTDAPAYAICPPDIDASFGSIYTKVLSTSGCGTDNPNTCHSTTGSSFSNLLDLSLDAGAVYAELLGADGGGHLSVNAAGDAAVLRVVPFDASASMLYIKLTLKSSKDPQYGSGMPLGTPGSVCPETLAAVQDWINGGAQLVPPEGGLSLDGGDAGDAGTDGDAGSGADATLE